MSSCACEGCSNYVASQTGLGLSVCVIISCSLTASSESDEIPRGFNIAAWAEYISHECSAV
jgi:hypothetical protein